MSNTQDEEIVHLVYKVIYTVYSYGQKHKFALLEMSSGTILFTIAYFILMVLQAIVLYDFISTIEIEQKTSILLSIIHPIINILFYSPIQAAKLVTLFIFYKIAKMTGR